MSHRDVMKKLLENFSDAEIKAIHAAKYFHRDLAKKYAYHGYEFTDVHGSVMYSPRFCYEREQYVEIPQRLK